MYGDKAIHNIYIFFRRQLTIVQYTLSHAIAKVF